VVSLDGRIVLGEESSALREKVKALLAEGKKKLVLDMKNVTTIDSSGLALLLLRTPARRLREHRCGFPVCRSVPINCCR